MSDQEFIGAFEDRLVAESRRLAEMHRQGDPEPVGDCALHRTAGPVKLSDCFEGKRDLIVIHNMGTGCSYCTMWADGINGLQHHLRDRAGLVLVSPDPPEVLEKFAAGRGWRFPLASAHGTTFIADMGFEADGSALPGVSTFFRNDDGSLVRVASEQFGPFDLFCPTWHFLARLRDGVDGWTPKFAY
ncbi:MAG: DUF899 family protein [Akkermansiaceae bacterium]|nr:DUF899 family protein [Akkermansiaceae bacterium]NNM29270.1 DUF899 family protein [Akkermansiaceae bacterium]